MIGWASEGTCQIARSAETSADWRVSESVPKLVHHLLADRSTLEILVGRIKWRKTKVRASLGDKDLILSQMGGRCVVLAMRDTPRVEWDAETGGISNT